MAMANTPSLKASKRPLLIDWRACGASPSVATALPPSASIE
jgi:hypothetical protein